jgi:hypothetical protein
MSAIFLSYRRDDSSGYAGRLFDNLAERFGRERVFMDIETLEPGMDFVAGIDRAIESCGAVIAMIGPSWIKAEDGDGRRRLDNPHDFIRLEITTALTRGVRVIPVLVHNAGMPPEQELPEPLRPLCRLQACEISDNRWEFDVRRLADVLEPLIAEPEKSATAVPSVAPADGVTSTSATPGEKSGSRTAGGWLAVLAVVVLGAGGGAWWLSQSTSTEQVLPPLEKPVASPPHAGTRSKAVATTVASPDSPAAPATEPTRLEPPAPAEPLPKASPDPRPTAAAEPVGISEPGGPSPDELRQREITELIEAAEIDLAELRLTRPAGNNAFDRFQRVLELEPHNPAAREGLIVIAERYHSLVEGALDRGALDIAQRHLESAGAVDPGADWLAPTQREIDRRRRVAAGSEPRPGRAPLSDAAEREACLSDCERSHQACRAEIDPQIEADCLRNRAQTCEQLYESCMSDSSRMYMGQVSHESECVGVHANCRRSAAKGCGAALQIAEEQCETQFDTCTRRCRGKE